MFDNELVPIRLDVAIDQHRFQDTFCWDSRGSATAAEAFAESLCHENKLTRAVVPTIVSAIHQQVAACKSANDAISADELIEERNEIVKLDIKLGSLRLHDQFAWSVNDPNSNPDDFATTICIENGVDRAFAPLISWHIRDQVLTHRQTANRKTTLPPVNPAVLEKQQPPSRRTRRKTAKPPADTGFTSTYSSGVVRRPEEWPYWHFEVGSADAQPSMASQPTSVMHSQDNVSVVPSQRTNNTVLSHARSLSSPQLPGHSTAASNQSQQATAAQSVSNWAAQQQQPLQQAARWTPHHLHFVQQAQAIWQKLNLAAVGMAMPQSVDEADNVIKALQYSQQSQQKQAENEASTRAQPLYGARPMTSPVQDKGGRPVHAQGYRYTPPQGSQAQMHPLLSDYAGMQYPGY